MERAGAAWQWKAKLFLEFFISALLQWLTVAYPRVTGTQPCSAPRVGIKLISCKCGQRERGGRGRAGGVYPLDGAVVLYKQQRGPSELRLNVSGAVCSGEG